jgi:hypothetical protein
MREFSYGFNGQLCVLLHQRLHFLRQIRLLEVKRRGDLRLRVIAQCEVMEESDEHDLLFLIG